MLFVWSMAVINYTAVYGINTLVIVQKYPQIKLNALKLTRKITDFMKLAFIMQDAPFRGKVMAVKM